MNPGIILVGIGALLAWAFFKEGDGDEFTSTDESEDGETDSGDNGETDSGESEASSGGIGAIFPTDDYGGTIEIAAPDQYAQAFTSAASQNDVPVALLVAQAKTESNFNASALGPQTKYGQAIGITQWLQTSADDPGYGIAPFDPRDPDASIAATGQYMRALYNQFGNWRDALIAYNWGPGNLASKPDKIPASAIAYANNIMNQSGVS